VGQVHGPEAAKDWFAQILGTFDWQVEATEFIDAGDVVVVVARQTGRGRESGAKVTQRIVYELLTRAELMLERPDRATEFAGRAAELAAGASYRPGTTAPGRVARAGRHRGRDVTTIGG
jgi:hypothetical protein